MKKQDFPELLTKTEVADYLRVSRATIKRWTKNGSIPFIRINKRGDMRFKKDDILALLN